MATPKRSTASVTPSTSITCQWSRSSQIPRTHLEQYAGQIRKTRKKIHSSVNRPPPPLLLCHEDKPISIMLTIANRSKSLDDAAFLFDLKSLAIGCLKYTFLYVVMQIRFHKLSCSVRSSPPVFWAPLRSADDPVYTAWIPRSYSLLVLPPCKKKKKRKKDLVHFKNRSHVTLHHRSIVVERHLGMRHV